MSLDYSFIFDESKDNSKQSTQKDFGVWGLNQDATVVEFKVWPQGLKGTGACIRYVVKISNNQYSGIIYAESKIYRGGKEVKPDDKSYEEAKQKNIREKMKTLVHIAKGHRATPRDPGEQPEHTKTVHVHGVRRAPHQLMPRVPGEEQGRCIPRVRAKAER